MKKNSSEKKPIPPLKTVSIVIIAAFGVLALSLVVLLCFKAYVNKLIKADHESAVEHYIAANSATVTHNADGSMTIQGYVNGVPFGYVENNTFCDGITLDGVPIGGNTFDEVLSLYYDKLNQMRSGIFYTVNYGRQSFVIDSSSFGLSTDIEAVLLEAMQIGRESDNDFLANYNRRIQVAQEGVEFTSGIYYDDDMLTQRINEISDLLDSNPVEPYITLRNLVGGGKPGVGTGGSSTDVYATTALKIARVDVAEAIFHNGTPGKLIDRVNFKQSILNAYNIGNYTAEIDLIADDVYPTSTAEQLKSSFGRISMFYTDFETSGTNRSRNVQKAAGLLNCIEIIPGEELTYNTILGPRTEADGWLQAAGISGGKEYVDSPGGGICQVSTTLYNALLMVGPNIEITQRSHHSIPGSYIALGLDATVSSYGPDLGWINNSNSSYFIVSYADMNAKRIYCCIFGAPDANGYTYRLRSEVVEVVEPEEPIQVAEPLWPTGYQKYVIEPRNRYVVNVYRETYNSAGVLVTEEYLYQDVYKSVRGELHYGTGPSSLPKPN